jgi:hypothetical protein
MIGHQAVGNDHHLVWDTVATQQAQEEEPVFLVKEDVLVIYPTVIDVVVVVNGRFYLSSHNRNQKEKDKERKGKKPERNPVFAKNRVSACLATILL